MEPCRYIYVHEAVCVSVQAGSGSPIMAGASQDFQRTESDRLHEVKGHLEIALLEKHFLRESAHIYNIHFTPGSISKGYPQCFLYFCH